MLPPNGFYPPVPTGRTNNNNYANHSKSAPTATSSSNQKVASGSKNTNVVTPSKNQSVAPLANDDDQLTKLLEDKISSFSSNRSNGAAPSESDIGKSTVNITDENSCLSLFDVSLPSTSSTLIAELMSETGSARGSSVDDEENSNCTTISATRILRESPVDGKLIETDINDISLSSFLGHLDAVYESETVTHKRDSDVSVFWFII